jgi:signal peptidase II
MKIGRPTLFGFILADFILISDQVSKWFVLEELNLRDVGQIPIAPFFNLTMVWNQGVSFGLLTAGSDWARWGLVALSAVISIGFAVYLTRAERVLTGLALGLVIGGAIGNLIDRVRFGAVADFLDFSALHFPWVFNVADASITIGAILLAYDLLVNDPKKPA